MPSLRYVQWREEEERWRDGGEEGQRMSLCSKGCMRVFCQEVVKVESHEKEDEGKRKKPRKGGGEGGEQKEE